MDKLLENSLSLLIDLAESKKLAVYTNAANVVRKEVLNKETAAWDRASDLSMLTLEKELRTTYQLSVELPEEVSAEVVKDFIRRSIMDRCTRITLAKETPPFDPNTLQVDLIKPQKKGESDGSKRN